jgi:hypothetical protein
MLNQNMAYASQEEARSNYSLYFFRESNFRMMRAAIIFDKTLVNVNLMGTDHKQIPSLLNALKKNTLTVSNIDKPLVQIDLFNSEAFIYSCDGNKYRIPIF